MAEIIDIRERLGRTDSAERTDGGNIYRVRLCGPDLHWVGAVGGVLARALALEGYYTAFEDPPPEDVSAPWLCLRAGRELITESGPERTPGLIVAAAVDILSPLALWGAVRDTLLLVYDAGNPEAIGESLRFPGTVIPLPVAVQTIEPLGVAVASAGGAARLLGTVRWPALERALLEELVVFGGAAAHRHLSLALEAFDRTAPWAGRVRTTAEEI